MAKLKKMKIMAPYIVEFYDHQIDVHYKDKVATHKVIGFFIEETEVYYVFSFWEMINCCEKTSENNRETFRILKSSIISIKQLR